MSISFFALAIAFATLSLYTLWGAWSARQKRNQVLKHMEEGEIHPTSSQYKVNPGNKAVTFYCMAGIASLFWAVGFSINAYTFSQTSAQGEKRVGLPVEAKKFEAINNADKDLVLTLLVPETFMLFAYITLVWQMLSVYFDAHYP